MRWVRVRFPMVSRKPGWWCGSGSTLHRCFDGCPATQCSGIDGKEVARCWKAPKVLATVVRP